MADNETTASSPAVEIKRSWGDEAEEEEPDTPSTSDNKTTSDLKLDSLSIHDTKKLHNFLDDPQDSNIKAVLSLSHSLSPSLSLTHSLYFLFLGFDFTFVGFSIDSSRVDPKLTAPQALCICPTRELAIQNMEVLKKMGNYTGITSECAIPMDSSNYVPISKRAPVTAQVVIGTPGTINKWVTAKKLSTNYLKILVFDEADHMLAESGFKDDSVRIMKAIVRCNPDCQVLLFSATFDDAVRAFVSKIVKDLFKGDYNQMFVNKEDLSLESVKQYKVKCPDELSKIMVIKDKIFELGQKVGQTIIFVRTRNSASTLHKTIAHDGYEVTTIQGALRQEDRDKIVKEFKDGLTQVLISTDLLARGFDQSQVNLVVNFDLPVKHEFPSEPDCEVYLHRVGRAGRFGRKGAVFNLLCNDRDDMIMSKIERHFNMEVAEVPSWRSNEDFEAALKKAGLI
ncbi:hypothetical protein TEA_016097 [Camellia sinensis var. sinensis]|uniref:RNA helicase n=1 Tax=Camellia sinensis var. sinensis TaxID=542762 RepID=A0A4S4DFV6_CAMSN|nr:hypothetical protein TEA_016097 [Camellia sinensis var. sinensis]